MARDITGIGAAVQGASSIAAAGIQASSANHASDLQAQAARNSLDFSKQVYGDQRTDAAPYKAAGDTGLNYLTSGSFGNIAPGSLTAPINLGIYGGDAGFSGTYAPNWADKAPAQIAPDFSFTADDLKNDPGYQFELDQGLQAQQRAAAATGATGGAAAKAIAQYTSSLANTHFNDAYQRAYATRQINSGQQNTNFGQYLTQNKQLNDQALNIFNTQATTYGINQGNQKDIYNANVANQTNAFNRYAALAGVGQTASQQLANNGTNAANQYANTSAQLGNSLSAGAVASGNAIASGVQNAGNAFSNYATYKSIYGTPKAQPTATAPFYEGDGFDYA